MSVLLLSAAVGFSVLSPLEGRELPVAFFNPLLTEAWAPAASDSPGVLTISSPLTLDKTTLTLGQTLNATVTYKNTGGLPITAKVVVITSRPPGGTNQGGPYLDLAPWLGVTTVQAGATLQVSASRTIASSDPTGAWYAFVTYQDASSLAWNDGPSVTFTVAPPAPTNQPPVVKAGDNQTITLPASANLSGTATDDGLPAGSTLTTTWSKVSGPGTVTFANANALSTTASFSAAGSYVLRLTANDSALSTTSDVALTVNPAPSPGVLTMISPLILDKTTVNFGQTLAATVTYKNTGGTPFTANVVVITSRPPGGTNQGGPYLDFAPWLEVTTIQPGATLQVSASRAFTSSDPKGAWYAFVTYQDASSLVWNDGSSVSFTVAAAPAANQPPVVNAGSDQTMELPAPANLNGTATDDGLPAGSTLTTTWSKVSGPGAVTFANANALSTMVLFSVPGIYVLRLTATDSVLSSTDDVTITVDSENQPPTVYAGTSQVTVLPALSNLSGTVTDDGLPRGKTLTTTWFKVSGPGAVTFGNANATRTTAQFSAAGTYLLRFAASDGALTATDSIWITVYTDAAFYYYVTATGSDSNSGSSSSPWKTIQKAADTLGAGDTVIVNGGTYNEHVQIARSGSSGSPTTYQAQGTVIMQGFSINASYIKINGFDISNSQINFPDSTGVFINGAQNELSNCYIHDVLNGAGVVVFGGPDANAASTNNNVVKHNTIVRARSAGIHVEGWNNIIESNDISHTLRDAPGSVPVTTADADGIRFFGTGNIIRNNYIHDIHLTDAGNHQCFEGTGLCPHIDIFQTWGPASNIIIEDNVVALSDDGLSFQQPYINPQWAQIEANPGAPVTNLLFRNNVFMHETTKFGPMNFDDAAGGPLSNITIVNNTFVRTNGPGAGGFFEYAILLTSSLGLLSNVTIENNTFYDCGSFLSSYVGVIGLTATISHNAVSMSSGPAPAGGPKPNDVWMVDPKFVDFKGGDFHLQAASPLIDAGATLPQVSQDQDGTARPKGPQYDIGAFEFF